MKYGFIGAGNMGSAIVKSLIRSTDDIVLSDRSGKAKVLAEELNIKYDTNEFIANNCEYIFSAFCIWGRNIHQTIKTTRTN